MLGENPELNQILRDGRELLGELVSKTDWYRDILSRLVLDEAFLASQRQSIDPNDIQIYFSPDKAFSVRAFIWEPEVKYPIHDHGAWGIVGAFINDVNEKKYMRLDDGSRANYAQVKMISDVVLKPGETTCVLPENRGIHEMKAMNGRTSVSIHVYGQAVRKGFIYNYDPNDNTLSRVYAPSYTKKVLAIKALGSVSAPWAEEILACAEKADNPEYIKRECRLSLGRPKC